ncbi:MAG: hypothetical protein AABY22_14515 [Nanoarchaeota archaeon]
MKKEVQLQLLEYKPSVDELRQEVKDLTEKYTKLIRSFYAKYTVIEHKNEILQKELEFLKSNICKG